MNHISRFLSVTALWLLSTTSQAGTLEEEVGELQQQWAIAKYKMAKSEQDAAFELLTKKAEALSEKFSERAEPKIWLAIIESTHAGVSGGLSALQMVKHARTVLEDAERINPDAMQGSVYTSLGSLYYQVPSWPLAFGDNDKADKYLKHALALNPDGIDPNYFYGDFLHRQGRDREAVKYLTHALEAPDRPGRPVADEGRRVEVRDLLHQVENQLAMKDK